MLLVNGQNGKPLVTNKEHYKIYSLLIGIRATKFLYKTPICNSVYKLQWSWVTPWSERNLLITIMLRNTKKVCITDLFCA
jgi:hypothetical protein